MTSRTVPLTRALGLADYETTWRAMQQFTEVRDSTTPDEIWLLEHPPVFTLGLNGNPAHLLAPGDIPVLHIDRGGQVTYHGPGQLVVYPLIDLKRAKLGIRDLVCALEQSVIETLAGYDIEAGTRSGAPGVYVDERKIASVGLRVRRGCTYHGLAFNISMDLEPFRRINPCGYAGLEVTQVADLGGPAEVSVVMRDFEACLRDRLGREPAASRVCGEDTQRNRG